MAGHAHQHIAPRSYLAAWAVDGFVSCHFVESGEVKRLPISNVAVRTHIYSVKLPDGTHNVELEKRIAALESNAVPLLRSIEQAWPLRGEDRGLLTEFIALQMVRGPIWRGWADETARRVLAEHRAANPEMAEEKWSQVEEALLGQEGMLDFMTSQLDKVGTMVGSMHWALLTFKKPRLTTCDHPVSTLDINVFRTKVAAGVMPPTGMLSAIEIRFPISPTHALVMSWLEGPDVIRSRAWAGLQENINYATRGQAERQWFSKPGEPVPWRDAVYAPLTVLVEPSYSLDAVQSSLRRQKVLEIVNAKIEHDHAPGMMAIIESVPASHD